MTGRYCLGKNLSWIVSENAIDVFPENLPSVHLAYPEAALWDLLSRRSKSDGLVEKLSLITETDVASTTKWVKQTLATWHDDNLIQEVR